MTPQPISDQPDPSTLHTTLEQPDSSQLTRIIKEEALRLGFLSAGVAAPEALRKRHVNLSGWLSAGFSGDLGYMEDFFNRQQKLREKIPNLKSILILTAPYENGREAAPAPDAGRIARYAHGKDYHRVLEKRVKKLEGFILSQVPVAQLVKSIDTAPVQERALAEAAGLGFIGKNTMLILPKGGSFVFLTALLTNLELVFDQPISWDCGNCTICLEACPTEALSVSRPYQLDAHKCIANLTIENREEISPPLREKTGPWLFGCDICQEVCPYNRKASHNTPWPEFQAQNGAGAALPLAEILACRTEETFLARFAGTPLMRAKREGLLRNAAVTAANLKNTGLIPLLQETAEKDSSKLVREHATWALNKLQTP